MFVSTADIDGQWGSWTSYSACPVTCGNGDRVRTRQCNNPAQSGKGLACQGASSQILVCSLSPCAVGKEIANPIKDTKIGINPTINGFNRLNPTIALLIWWNRDYKVLYIWIGCIPTTIYGIPPTIHYWLWYLWKCLC